MQLTTAASKASEHRVRDERPRLEECDITVEPDGQHNTADAQNCVEFHAENLVEMISVTKDRLGKAVRDRKWDVIGPCARQLEALLSRQTEAATEHLDEFLGPSCA